MRTQASRNSIERPTMAKNDYGLRGNRYEQGTEDVRGWIARQGKPTPPRMDQPEELQMVDESQPTAWSFAPPSPVIVHTTVINNVQHQSHRRSGLSRVIAASLALFTAGLVMSAAVKVPGPVSGLHDIGIGIAAAGVALFVFGVPIMVLASLFSAIFR